MVAVFKTIFGEMYPTDITNQEYLEKAMQENIFLVIVEEKANKEKIVSIASSDVYPSRKCVGKLKVLVELTAELGDCATLSEYQSKKFMTTLLIELENQLAKLGYLYFFSLTRAISPGLQSKSVT